MRIFITGGSGSLGMALLSRFEKRGHTCTIYSRDEVKQGEARAKHAEAGHRFILGDVRDAEWLQICMRNHEVVIHAAAYKQIPSSEANVGEAVETNVIGSRNVARAALLAGVQRVVGISTDKACEPVNAYGATKALMEKLFQQSNDWGGPVYTLVRYGNVLRSRGSVVPFFEAQLASGRPITITDDRMTRFWLTLDQAVDLVESALTIDRGVILVPKAPASNMHDLARAVVELKNPDLVEIEITGIRPGEKMHEKMVHAGESMHSLQSGEYFYIYPPGTPKSRMQLSTLPEGFSYSSDRAPQLTVKKLVALLK